MHLSALNLCVESLLAGVETLVCVVSFCMLVLVLGFDQLWRFPTYFCRALSLIGSEVLGGVGLLALVAGNVLTLAGRGSVS